jgi:hypothetical protein
MTRLLVKPICPTPLRGQFFHCRLLFPSMASECSQQQQIRVTNSCCVEKNMEKRMTLRALLW